MAVAAIAAALAPETAPDAELCVTALELLVASERGAGGAWTGGGSSTVRALQRRAVSALVEEELGHSAATDDAGAMASALASARRQQRQMVEAAGGAPLPAALEERLLEAAARCEERRVQVLRARRALRAAWRSGVAAEIKGAITKARSLSVVATPTPTPGRAPAAGSLAAEAADLEQRCEGLPGARRRVQAAWHSLWRGGVLPDDDDAGATIERGLRAGRGYPSLVRSRAYRELQVRPTFRRPSVGAPCPVGAVGAARARHDKAWPCCRGRPQAAAATRTAEVAEAAVLEAGEEVVRRQAAASRRQARERQASEHSRRLRGRLRREAASERELAGRQVGQAPVSFCVACWQRRAFGLGFACVAHVCRARKKTVVDGDHMIATAVTRTD
jgi:hypothetical protein